LREGRENTGARGSQIDKDSMYERERRREVGRERTKKRVVGQIDNDSRLLSLG